MEEEPEKMRLEIAETTAEIEVLRRENDALDLELASSKAAIEDAIRQELAGLSSEVMAVEADEPEEEPTATADRDLSAAELDAVAARLIVEWHAPSERSLAECVKLAYECAVQMKVQHVVRTLGPLHWPSLCGHTHSQWLADNCLVEQALGGQRFRQYTAALEAELAAQRSEMEASQAANQLQDDCRQLELDIQLAEQQLEAIESEDQWDFEVAKAALEANTKEQLEGLAQKIRACVDLIPERQQTLEQLARDNQACQADNTKLQRELERLRKELAALRNSATGAAEAEQMSLRVAAECRGFEREKKKQLRTHQALQKEYAGLSHVLVPEARGAVELDSCRRVVDDKVLELEDVVKQKQDVIDSIEGLSSVARS
eukprot:TRINITY_DN2492_c0_g2_i1.p1 TRINITY_DN2492_c0_g2~~TRINITY_DN2492_c0_g2_i1.p1  ORF type:complete len:374 (+),score=111.81 TRINITY_DN2492_c0_g2_i1:23-1144(+)